ncbi:chromosome segregation SMC protein [Alloactinosynnema sp. L-07]|uniref:AAA family ATPase n=1 Tax=Alloactinosynnema sp. L-07 TaxID=1653480 RepID=UPI00065EEFA5|nr:AAA family ATPase [Alloactinosynnema sp. L-07]CRK61214.1 chromosome segregation SMC protein [Alloactinosynnema sp. L-07]
MSNSEHSADLVATLADRADQDPTISDDAKLFVFAALDGDDELAAALEGDYVVQARQPVTEASREPVGAYLTGIEVTGFRGIGPTSKLDIQPGPGLTIVAGRNGSGKSTFADALEVALTGDTYRWRNKKTVIWREHWRNLHQSARCSVAVDLAEEGVGTTRIGVDWADATDVHEHTTWVQRHSKPRESGISALGWDRAVDLHRPILSYDELGGMLHDGPAALFDKLDAILGIDQATDAHARLAAAAKQLAETDKAAKAEARSLKAVLAESADERATVALGQLKKRVPDIDAVRAVATGTDSQPMADIARLRELTRLRAPDERRVAEAVADLRAATAELVTASVAATEHLVRRTALLRQALDFHKDHGDSLCPVCGVGTLDDTWRTRVAGELADEDEGTSRHRRAVHHRDAARDASWSLVRSFVDPVAPQRFSLSAAPPALAAAARWRRLPDDDSAIADHLENLRPELDSALAGLRAEAETALSQYEDTWAPIAVRLAGWCSLATRARAEQARLSEVTAAADFLKASIVELRDTRMRALGDKARAIWAALRQESNVDLGAVELKGQATRRRVELRADVDGADAQALGVMSQGELHALTLALFLPRATVEGSPFRFIVLDDPVQAMDPSKVDGFAGVLHELAKTRQVVVFTHDDRLPQAVRDLGIDARIVDVLRGVCSEVDVQDGKDLAWRYLDDAFAVAKDDRVPNEIRNKTAGMLCRMAVEAAGRDVYMGRRFRSGDARTEIESGWDAVPKTRGRMELALNGPNVERWLDDRGHKWAFHALGKSAHECLTGDPVELVRRVRGLVRDLKAVR